MKIALYPLVWLAILLGGAMLAQTETGVEGGAYRLGFSTYLSHTDKYAANFDVCTDAAGNTYVSGNTRDRNFPATAGAYQTDLKGDADAFVVKYSPAGEIVFATLLGGSRREHHTGITVDKDGYIYLVGGTHSADFPVTPGAFDTTFNGEGEWAGDVFVAKLDPSGSHLVFATFLGGEVDDTAGAGDIAVDSVGNIVVAGTTCSKDFPATSGVIDDQFTNQDSFVSKLSPDGRTLLMSTSLGNGVMDMITGLALDDHDRIYVTGFTLAADLPTSDDALRRELIRPRVGGFEDGIDHFVAKIDGSGRKLLYLTYLGAGGHMGSTIAWAPPDRLAVCGSTKEDGFPVTDKAIGWERRGERDGFITVFDSDDMSLLFSSFLGGSESDHVMTCSFLDENTVVIGGKTSSANFPLTENAQYADYPVWETTFNNTFRGRRESFVSVVDIKHGRLLYSTFLGACFQLRTDCNEAGDISFVAESGQREAAGTTGFPVVGDRSEEPPTYLMVGRLGVERNGD